MEHILIAKVAVDLINQYDLFIKKEYELDTQYDVVYILKQSENNPDLKYSLRSLDKFCNFKNIWIIGYKPTWVTNVKYIPTDQTQGKWANIKLNWETACTCDEISKNFVLMNDDFITIRPIIDWESSLNLCTGRIDERAQNYNDKSSNWQKAFIHLTDVFNMIGCTNFYDFELHLPTIINRVDFMNMLQIPKIKEYWNDESKVFHQRSACKNIYWNNENPKPKVIKDVKMMGTRDMRSTNIENNSWISVPDNMIGNNKVYPKLNSFLEHMFPNKSRFEL